MIRPSEQPENIALEKQRHACEVAYVIRTCFPSSEKARNYFALCEEHRPLEDVERLRVDTREAWRTRALLIENQRRGH